VCTAALVDRMDKAAPNLPPKLMLRVPIEKAGSVIDQDNLMSATIGELRERKAELAKEAHTLADELKRLADAAKAADADSKKSAGERDCAHAAAQAKLRETIALKNTLRTVEELEAALESVDPETELLLHLVEKGVYQDTGRDIQTMFKVRVPYDTMRKRLADMHKMLAQEADESKGESA
jgi:hypothetical protein